MDQLQVREAHLSSDKVSADQTSDNINAKDNMMSPELTSGKVKASRKSHTLLSSETPDFVGTFRLIPSDSRLTLKKVKK